jgi:hypothetical protein
MKGPFYFLLLVVVFNSCDTSPDQLPENKVPLEQSADDKFIGVWKYYSSNFEKNGKGDGSMDGQIATLSILEGTKETYTFRFLHFALLFSKKDDSTLEGVTSKFILRYHQSNQHLKFNLGKGNFDEFKKLK